MTQTQTVFAIDGEFTIYRTAELSQALQTWLSSLAGPARLDLSGVSEMDSAGLQLLLALQRTARERTIALTLAPISPAVREVLRLTALERQLSSEPEQTV